MKKSIAVLSILFFGLITLSSFKPVQNNQFKSNKFIDYYVDNSSVHNAAVTVDFEAGGFVRASANNIPPFGSATGNFNFWGGYDLIVKFKFSVASTNEVVDVTDVNNNILERFITNPSQLDYNVTLTSLGYQDVIKIYINR